MLELEVSYGKLSSKDLSSLVDALREVHVRSIGLGVLFNIVQSRYKVRDPFCLYSSPLTCLSFPALRLPTAVDLEFFHLRIDRETLFRFPGDGTHAANARTSRSSRTRQSARPELAPSPSRHCLSRLTLCDGRRTRRLDGLAYGAEQVAMESLFEGQRTETRRRRRSTRGSYRGVPL
jgi:hypothetical protein